MSRLPSSLHSSAVAHLVLVRQNRTFPVKSIFITILALALTDRLAVADVTFPTDNIIKNYEWCGAAKTATERLQRFEAFWTRYHPKNEEYGDAIDHTFVRLAAYRLVMLYADAGNHAKCAEFLKWLETHDQAIPR